MAWIVLALALFVFQIATILVLEFRNPAKAVAWLVILFVFPIVGFILFQQTMIRKAKEGVEVRFLFDGVGSYKLSGRYIRELKEAGVEVHFFLPPFIAFFDKRINYRNHRKIVVVDGFVGFLGGTNIGDEYLGADPKLGYWRDTHIRLKGDSVRYLQHTFATDWAFASGRTLADARYFPEHGCAGDVPVQLIASGPDAPWDAALEVFFGAIVAARSRIYIETPYFIPDPSIAMALKTAAVSGVDVRIVMPGVSDSRIVHWATLSYVPELMQAGVRFYRYRKGFMHALTLIVDRMLATVGTANMDMRSFFNNFEIMAVLYDRETIRRLERDFLRDLQDSDEIGRRSSRSGPGAKGPKSWPTACLRRCFDNCVETAGVIPYRVEWD